MTIQYTPRGVCSRSFTIQVEDGPHPVCPGSGRVQRQPPGLSMLLKGMPVEEAIRRMEGIRCGSQGHLLPRPAGPGPEAGPGLRLSRFRT